MKDKYKRLWKMMFAAVLVIGMTCMYGYVWIGHYNKHILEFPFWRRGNWMVIALYALLLSFLMNTYGGFKIGYLRNGNLIYSQMISVIFANVFTYFQIAVIDKHFVTPSYLIQMTIAEFAFICLWTMVFWGVYHRAFPARRMLFIDGNRQDSHVIDKMNSREDKYVICETVSYAQDFAVLQEKINQYDAVLVGDMPSHERNQILKYCFDSEIRSYSVPKITDILMRSSTELNLFDTPLLLSRNIGLTIEQQFAKRLEDVIISTLMLIVFSPIFLIAAIGIKCTDHGPIFYKQLRLTKDGENFWIYKFRTMVVDAESKQGPVLAAEKDPRIIPIGRFLRATRLDELPQVINILKGDMSLVGPRPERPELAEEIEKDIPEFRYRLKVKAGLTGYAQIYGKYNTTAYDKLKLDLSYIRNFSLLLDLKLILMTPKIMLMKESTEGVKTDNTDR